MEVIDRIGDRWSALWESASSDYLLLAILIIIAIPLFALVMFIALSPGILFEMLGEYLRKRFPEQSKSKNVRSWFSLIAVGLFALWLYFLGSLLDRL